MYCINMYIYIYMYTHVIHIYTYVYVYIYIYIEREILLYVYTISSYICICPRGSRCAKCVTKAWETRHRDADYELRLHTEAQAIRVRKRYCITASFQSFETLRTNVYATHSRMLT